MSEERADQQSDDDILRDNALTSSAAHLRSILATVPDAMIVIDDRGRILSFSAAAERMFGYVEADLVGLNVSVLMSEPHHSVHDSYLNRYLETGERRIIGIGRVTSARHVDGTVFPIELSIGETKTPAGRFFTGFIRDLTERQKTEGRLQELQQELVHVSRVSAMGGMASALAHELNQPLTAVANYLEAARDMLNDPTEETLAIIREALDEAAGQSVRAGQIVRRLRDFIARGEGERRIESLSRLINEACALALVGAGERSLRTHIDLEFGLDRVLVDRIQVQQVLVNLVRNAMEAMEGVEIPTLTIKTRREPGGMVRVSVIDNGSGIDDSAWPNLFKPFVSTKESGMGLGLSICRTIIEAQEGRIWADRLESGGTVFHFTLIDVDNTL